MAGAPAMLWTVSYQSDSAVEYDERTHTWTFESGMNRLKAFRIQLVSLEFPMTQRTLEEGANRFYYSEGFFVSPLGRHVRLEETVFNPSSTVEIDAVLPLSMQYGTVAAVVGTVVTINTLDDARTAPSPHALWVGPNHQCIVDFWREYVGSGEAMQVILPDLAVDLACSALTRISDTSFTLNLAAAPPASVVPGVVVVLTAPAVSRPTAGALLVTWIFGLYPVLNNYRVTFDLVSSRTVIQATGGVFPGTRLLVLPTNANDLLFWLGYTTSRECTAAGSACQGVGWLGSAQIATSGCWPGCGQRVQPPAAGAVGHQRHARVARAARGRPVRRRLAARPAGDQHALPAQGFRPDFPAAGRRRAARLGADAAVRPVRDARVPGERVDPGRRDPHPARLVLARQPSERAGRPRCRPRWSSR